MGEESLVHVALAALSSFVCRPHGFVRVEEYIPKGEQVHITLSYVLRDTSLRIYRIVIVDKILKEALSMCVHPWGER